MKSMQSYKAGLSQALANHEDMLLKAQRAPGEGVQGAGLQRRCAAESAAPAPSHCAGVRASAAAVEGEPAAPTGLQELTKDDYDSFLRDAGEKLVVVDFYTDWYAPPAGSGRRAAARDSEQTTCSAVMRAARVQPRLRWAGSHLCMCGNRCGPCKMILPQLVEMAAELKDRVSIVKFNCNKYNKDLGISLGIKVAPTFLLYKHGEQVASCSG